MKGTGTVVFAAGILGVHDMGGIESGKGLRDVMREQERFSVRRSDIFHNPNGQRRLDVDDHRHNDK